jgi:hypothetical protein
MNDKDDFRNGVPRFTAVTPYEYTVFEHRLHI